MSARAPSPHPQPEALPRRELRGMVERITYQNPENGYTVARLAPDRELVTEELECPGASARPRAVRACSIASRLFRAVRKSTAAPRRFFLPRTDRFGIS